MEKKINYHIGEKDWVKQADMNDCWTTCSYHVMEYELSILVDEGIKIEGFKKI